MFFLPSSLVVVQSNYLHPGHSQTSDEHLLLRLTTVITNHRYISHLPLDFSLSVNFLLHLKQTPPFSRILLHRTIKMAV